MLLNFVLSVFVAKKIGATDLGHVNYVISFVTLFAPLYTLGLDEILIKEIVSRKDKQKVLDTVGFLRTFSSSLTFVVLIIFSFILKTDQLTVGLIAIYGFSFLFKSQEAYLVNLQARQEFYKLSMSKNIANILSALLKVGFLFSDLSFEFLLYIASFEVISYTVIPYLYSGMPKVSFKYDSELLRKFLKLVPSLIILYFTFGASSRIDQIMIGKYINHEELGFYSVVSKIIELSLFVPIMLTTYFLPKMVSDDSFNKKLLKYTFFLSIFGALGFFVLGEFVISLIYGDKFTGAMKYIPYYSLLIPFLFIHTVRSKTLVVLDKLKEINVYNVTLVISNILMNWYIIVNFQRSEFIIIGTILSHILAIIVSKTLSKNG